MTRTLSCAAAGAVLCVSPARSDILLYQQLPNGLDSLNADTAGNSPRQQVADNFVFQQKYTITRAAFWGIYSGSSGPLNDQFTVKFFEGDSSVDTIVHTTPTTNITRTHVGTIFGFDEYYYEVELVLPFTPDPETQHWFSVRNNTTGDFNRTWSWETSDGMGDGSAYTTPGSGGWQIDANRELSFELYGIPSPGTSLIGVAFFMISARRRR